MGVFSLQTALEVTKFLRTEFEYIPFKSGAGTFEHLEVMFR
jgi:hypothetical protein